MLQAWLQRTVSSAGGVLADVTVGGSVSRLRRRVDRFRQVVAVSQPVLVTTGVSPVTRVARSS